MTSDLDHRVEPHRFPAGCSFIAALLMSILVIATAALAAAPSASAADNGVALSNEVTITRWASAWKRAPIRAEPVSTSRKIGKLRYSTTDGEPEVYLVQRRYSTSRATWLKIRVPDPPNETTGWVREGDLEELTTVRTQLVIDKSSLRATLYRKGRRVFSAPVGIGAEATPTPEGKFWIREGLRIPSGGGAYGVYAFGTSAFSSIDDWPGAGPPTVGIHGTNEPGLIPGRPSHGCIRMRNGDISRLRRLMPVGTPLWIKS
ncbi:MAG: L,D-transpeptidase [Solirubrobacterales bacterium]|nr:L,D-transpeptidase [Solirubrobacterales bacterium]